MGTVSSNAATSLLTCPMHARIPTRRAPRPRRAPPQSSPQCGRLGQGYKDEPREILTSSRSITLKARQSLNLQELLGIRFFDIAQCPLLVDPDRRRISLQPPIVAPMRDRFLITPAKLWLACQGLDAAVRSIQKRSAVRRRD